MNGWDLGIWVGLGWVGLDGGVRMVMLICGVCGNGKYRMKYEYISFLH